MALSLSNGGAREAQAASARTGGDRRQAAARADDLAGWLAHADALHAQTIDMGLERVAAVRIAATSEPAPGSVRPKQASFSPRACGTR